MEQIRSRLIKPRKPLVQYQRGSWYCHQPTLYANSFAMGQGKTPLEAIKDFIRKNRLGAHHGSSF